MESSQRRQDANKARPGVKRCLFHAVVATLWVTTLPLLALWWIESSTAFNSAVLSALIGVGLSATAAVVGSIAWMHHPASRDVVFADLMIWGLVRRLRSEKLLRDMSALLDASTQFHVASDLEPGEQIRILRRLASALEATDPYTHGHSHRVTRHSHMIAKAMKLPREEIELIRIAAAVHDVGKIYVPYDVLTKPGKLTEDEYAAMKQHAAKGAQLVSQVGNSRLTALVRHHHERLDGRGYPDGRAGSKIPLGARIIAVADTFDAITSTRSYRSAMRHKKAIEILKKESGSQLDPAVVKAFLAYYSGRASKAWWATLTTAPQRGLGHLFSLLGGAGASSIAGTAAVAGTAAIVAGVAFGPGAAVNQSPELTPVVSLQGAVRPLLDGSHARGGSERPTDAGTSRSRDRRSDGRSTPEPGTRPTTDLSSEEEVGGAPSQDSESPTSGGASGSPDGPPDGSGSGSSGSDGDPSFVDEAVDTTSDAVDEATDTLGGTVDDVEDLTKPLLPPLKKHHRSS
jgi:hypothetical protein